MPAIKDWLTDAAGRLSAIGIDSANLDAEIILANILDKNRTYLHAHPEQLIDKDQLAIANSNLDLRLNRVPVAYIVGHKEFYGREFAVSPATLIPRPESEDIINVLKEILLSTTYQIPPTKLIDIGTGSGCLGITAKLEFPNLDVTLADISADALLIASLNANALAADVDTLQSDLLHNYPQKPDIIIANLPYVDKTWDRSPETDHEPALALFAAKNGMEIIEKLIVQASDSLSPNGYIIIESDPTQHNSLIEFAKKQSFKLINQMGYIIVFKHQC